MTTADQNTRPAPDPEMEAIADYVCNYRVESSEAYDTARLCLMDSLGCAMLALGFMGGHHNGLNGSAIIIAVGSRALSVFTRMMRAAPALTMRGLHRSCAAGWPRLAVPAGGCSTPAA